MITRGKTGIPGALLLAALFVFLACARPAATPVTPTAPTTTLITTTPAAPATTTVRATTISPTTIAVPTTAATTAKPTVTAIAPYGELTIALTSFSREEMDPITGSGALYLMGPNNDHLLRLDGTKTVAGIAEKWAVATDGLSWTFYIRRGVKFQDGTEVNGKDVKFSLERYASKAAFSPIMRDAVSSVELVDDYTVRVNTKGPQPFLPQYVTLWIPAAGLVMPKDYIEKNGIEYYKTHPIGAGPYQMVRYVGGDMAQYQAFDKYWRGAPEFKTLSLVVVPEENTRVAMLKTGQADVGEISIDNAGMLEKVGFSTHVTDVYTAQVHFTGVHDPRAAGMPLADIKVRQALSLAINRDEIGKSFFIGKMGPAMPAFLSESNWDIDIPYWRTYAAKLYRYDVIEAKRLLAEAGYPNGFSVKLFSYAQTGAAYLPQMAELIQGYWLKIGAKAEISPVEWGTFRSYVGRPQNMQVVGQASTGRYTGEPNIQSGLGTGYTTGTYGLYTGSPDYDRLQKLLTSARTETNDVKRVQLVAEFVKTVTDSYTAVQIGSVPALIAIGPMIDGSGLPRPIQHIVKFTDYFRHRK